ncbi:hypothetical protein EVAR_70957_1 [Eumeta japonica]|uniref:Uncharacterized protein n=1 Tax=Eumeta variegata TaxID=151549 RepID=A0A4C1SP87_EUMVA|nr:hypothetical protein EVAR_70957_1 [Eumeta japonica]
MFHKLNPRRLKCTTFLKANGGPSSIPLTEEGGGHTSLCTKSYPPQAEVLRDPCLSVLFAVESVRQYENGAMLLPGIQSASSAILNNKPLANPYQ